MRELNMGSILLNEGYRLRFNPLAFWCPRFGFIRRPVPCLQLVNVSLLSISAPSCEMRPSRDGYYVLSIYRGGLSSSRDRELLFCVVGGAATLWLAAV